MREGRGRKEGKGRGRALNRGGNGFVGGVLMAAGEGAWEQEERC